MLVRVNACIHRLDAFLDNYLHFIFDIYENHLLINASYLNGEAWGNQW